MSDLKIQFFNGTGRQRRYCLRVGPEFPGPEISTQGSARPMTPIRELFGDLEFQPRVIPTLLISRGRLVKTIQFGSRRYVGDPINAARILSDKGADELIVLDIDSGASDFQIDFSMIERLASSCEMAVTYGGGIDSVGDALQVVRLGVEKVSLNSAALDRPDLVSEIASLIGSQSVIGSINVVVRDGARYAASGSSPRPVLPEKWAAELETQGAGEILLYSVDRDGMYTGFDLSLIRSVSEAVKIPIISSGGASSANDFVSAVAAGAAAVAAGSVFLFHGRHKAVLVTYL